MITKEARRSCYCKGKPVSHSTGLYKDENTLLALYHNDKLVSGLDYDSLGTVIREWTLINEGKDSFVSVYIPYYENAVLKKREQVIGNTIFTEEYQYLNYPDSSIIASQTRNDFTYTTTRASYTSKNKLLYKESVTRGKMGNNFFLSFKFILSYDSAGRKTEYTSMTDNKIRETEKFYYQDDRRTLSVKTDATGRLISRTFYE